MFTFNVNVIRCLFKGLLIESPKGYEVAAEDAIACGYEVAILVATLYNLGLETALGDVVMHRARSNAQ